MDKSEKEPITRQLVGQELKDGWKVVRRLPRPGEEGAENATGGNFSVGYLCEKDGTEAFLKVFDIFAATQAEDFVQALLDVATAFDHESALLRVCSDAKLSRIVRCLAMDKIKISAPGHSAGQIPICYIIFEKADGGDIRNLITRVGAIEDAAKLEMLHQVVVAASQLHTVGIAHQDVKPSNVLIFEESGEGAKLADLGRASMKGRQADHDGEFFACQGMYAPLEQLYGYSAPDWHERREACDLYQFGALVCFLFTAKNATVAILDYVPKAYWPGAWRGAYVDVLPFLQQGLANFLEDAAPLLPAWGRDKMLLLIRHACDPDVHRRGDPDARRQAGSPIGIDRFVSRMDSLRLEALLQARKVNGAVK